LSNECEWGFSQINLIIGWTRALMMTNDQKKFLHWSFLKFYEGKSISKLQMDIELKQIRVLIWKMLLFLNIIYLYIEALVPSFHKSTRVPILPTR
jgi:hypothetical protein